MTTLNDFMAANQGQPLEVEDSNNKDQCFDLAFGWTDALGIPREAIRHLFAYQIFTNPNPVTYEHFEVVANTPTNVPRAGDLVIFGSGLGRAGHVSIFIDGNARTFRSFDQNWDTVNYHDEKGNPICRVVDHNYDYVLGWLHPKVLDQPNEGTEIMSATNPDNGEVRDAQGWLNAYIERNRQWQADERVIGDLRTQLTAQQTEIDRLHSQSVQTVPNTVLPAPGPAWTPTSNPQAEPYPAPVNATNNTSNGSGFALGRYNKAWVAIAGGVVQVATWFMGANDPATTALVSIATALGVFSVKNKG